MSWSTNPVAPVKQTGKGWFESGAEASAPVKGGWFALIEKVAPMRGEGNLTAVVNPRRFERVSFSGEGEMTPVLNPRNYRNAAFSGNGLPTGEMFETRSIDAHFSSSGKLDLDVPFEDGLHASMAVGYPANFNASGGLTVVVEGGRPAFDGLYADMIGRYFIPAYFTSEGQFVAFIGVLQIALADMIGSGALTADVKQIHPRLAQLAATGQLSATVVRGAAAAAQLLGTGTLSAPVFARYLTSLGVSGSGALTALLKASYSQTADSGGTGTMAALVMQRYLIDMSVGGGTGYLTVPDDFNRANNDASLGSNWTNRLDVLGIVGNAASLTPSSGGGWNIASHNTPMESDDMEASVILGGSNSGVMLGLGFSEAGEGAFVYNAGDANYYLYQQTNWNSWSNVSTDEGTAATGGDKLTIRRVGNVYFVLLNDVQQGIWTDSANNIPRDSSHRLVDIGIYSGGTYDSFEAISEGGVAAGAGNTPPFSGAGVLSAQAFRRHSIIVSETATGTLSATMVKATPDITNISPSSGAYDTTITITGTNFVPGSTSITIGGVLVRNSNVTATQITCLPPAGMTNGAKTVQVTTPSGSDTATFTYSFSAFNETNTNRSNAAVPSGSQGCWSTLFGSGAGGGQGSGGALSNRGGGGGGGGGAYIQRVFIPRDSMGATYSVVYPLGGASQTNGAAATFVSGSVSLSAGGGVKGGNGGTTGNASAGTGGVATASGVTATLNNGGNGGGGGSPSSAGTTASPNSPGAPGGGGGGGRSSFGTSYAGGHGGPGVVGGSAGSGASANGSTGGAGGNNTAGTFYAGGGGGGGCGSNGNTVTGGNGGDFGAGGGGGGGGNSVYQGGVGGDGATLIEWI